MKEPFEIQIILLSWVAVTQGKYIFKNSPCSILKIWAFFSAQFNLKNWNKDRLELTRYVKYLSNKQEQSYKTFLLDTEDNLWKFTDKLYQSNDLDSTFCLLCEAHSEDIRSLDTHLEIDLQLISEKSLFSLRQYYEDVNFPKVYTNI